MTKKEYHKQINKRFYTYVEENFPQYEIDPSEGYGRIYLVPERKDDAILYHQSEHTLCQLNWASEESKNDMKIMEDYINNNIIPFVNTILNN